MLCWKLGAGNFGNNIYLEHNECSYRDFLNIYIIGRFYCKVSKYMNFFLQKREKINKQRQLLTTGRLNINFTLMCDFVLFPVTP